MTCDKLNVLAGPKGGGKSFAAKTVAAPELIGLPLSSPQPNATWTVTGLLKSASYSAMTLLTSVVAPAGAAAHDASNTGMIVSASAGWLAPNSATTAAPDSNPRRRAGRLISAKGSCMA